MSKVKEAAIALVAKFKQTTAVHEEVEALEAAIVEEDGGAPAVKPKRVRKKPTTT